MTRRWCRRGGDRMNPNMQVEEVKVALRAGTASPSTSHALQLLLRPEERPKTSEGQANARAAKPNVTSASRAGVTRPKKVATTVVREDGPGLLSARGRYALATETVNICLKTLTESLKTQKTKSPPSKKHASSPPATPDQNQAAPQRALQPRTGNNTTPARRSPDNSKPARRISSQAQDSKKQENVINTAECARLAFSYLRTADPKKLGVSPMPPWQIENGMLALAGKMMAHGLEDLAIGELRLVKRSLESYLGIQRASTTTKDGAGRKPEETKKETLASLLRLNVSIGDETDVLAVAIIYSFQVLKLISASRKPVVIEEALQYLQPKTTNSPVDLLLRQAELSEEKSKCAKQLENLSQTILGLCPSVAPTSDGTATNRSQSPSARAAFELQSLALRIRTLWWKLADHQSDIAKEMVEPYLKCAAAFIRRCPAVNDAAATYDLLGRSFTLLGPLGNDASLFTVHNLLASQAARAGLHSDSESWLKQMTADCSSLEHNHVRRAICTVRKSCLSIEQHPTQDHSTDLGVIADLLQTKFAGVSADYDIFIVTLSTIVRQACTLGHNSGGRSSVRLLSLAASFSLRYSSSYPGKNTQQVQSILETALKVCHSTDDLLSWVTEAACALYIREGVLTAVANAAESTSLSSAWTISASAISLSRVLRVLLLRAVRSTTVLAFDGEDLEPRERLVLLEWQLRYVVEVAVKTKYHDALRRIVPDLLSRLSGICAADEFPVRRARIAIAVFKLWEAGHDLLAQNVWELWSGTELVESTDLGEDAGLREYVDDVRINLTLARTFSNGRPTVHELKPFLLDWEWIIDGNQDQTALCRRIDEAHALVSRLEGIAAYFAMLGEDAACLATRRPLNRVLQVLDEDSSVRCTALVDLARQYLELGYSESAASVFGQARCMVDKEEVSRLSILQYHVAYAEHCAITGELGSCQISLDAAASARSEISAGTLSREGRRTYEILHAHHCLIRSKCLLKLGSPHQALGAAKQAVRILSTIWANLERSSPQGKGSPAFNASDVGGAEVRELSNQVSKLQLKPAQANAERNPRGAAFWSLVPLLTKALLHLSDMYAHHGLFADANYYSERAVQIAESVGSSILLSRARSHRARLLTSAGRTEDAELCLALDDDRFEKGSASLAVVERLCARAAVQDREGALEEALRLYEEANAMLLRLGSADTVTRAERFEVEREVDRPDSRAKITAPSREHGSQAVVKASAKASKATAKVTGPKRRAKEITVDSMSIPKPEDKVPSASGSCDLLSKWRASVLVYKALIENRLGQDASNTLVQVDRLLPNSLDVSHRRQAEFQELMRQATTLLETDVTLIVLTESTLSFPAIIDNGSGSTKDRADTLAVSKKPGTAKTNAKIVKKQTVEMQICNALEAARDVLMKDHSASIQRGGTIQTHTNGGMLSNATIMLSAIMDSMPGKSFHPIHASLTIDLPRMKAVRFEQKAVSVDCSHIDDSGIQEWLNVDRNEDSWPGLTAAEFQTNFIDIIPKSWTAVSLCLSNDASELYIARYRSGQSPLILKLPFSRQHPEGLDEDVFDYHHGSAELQEIIQLSNYSCHNPVADLKAKGAKTNWWSEREALDRRLHELLINIENIWLGGFKGVFSKHQRSSDLLQKFRRSFEDILDRHLHSRKATKGRAEKLSLDDQVLELFIGLSHDEDGCLDLDDHIADLLYFVVDMLQFSGERNAYDEIDFDSMAVEVLDALRSYHQSDASSGTENGHLILVLDKRLQAFPWESLPCLEAASVSRVGSMLSLQERILAQRSSRDRDRLTTNVGDCHVVSRSSGMYILNPSSDLPGTQTTLEPVLSSLGKSEKSTWTGIVNEPPSEGCFITALEESSILLYFGHGAGSQYARPRSIKRLDRCSDVVWLMGCSSGAVSEHGDLEPSAVPLSYLIAGNTGRHEAQGSEASVDNNICMAVVATLWDVTDKDIDRFSLALGNEWCLWPATEQTKIQAKTPKKRQLVVAPSTPQQVPKTLKTPKVVQTPATVKTPVRDRSRIRKEDDRKLTLAEAVSRSREACYLRYLNGAAPVVYGVPVVLDD